MKKKLMGCWKLSKIYILKNKFKIKSNLNMNFYFWSFVKILNILKFKFINTIIKLSKKLIIISCYVITPLNLLELYHIDLLVIVIILDNYDVNIIIIKLVQT